MCITTHRLIRVPFELPPFHQFPPGQVPVCSCGWPMTPERLGDGRPSDTTFYCPYHEHHKGEDRPANRFPAAFCGDQCPPCPLCGETANANVLPEHDGSGYTFYCQGAVPGCGYEARCIGTPRKAVRQ